MFLPAPPHFVLDVIIYIFLYGMSIKIILAILIFNYFVF